jgi:hypothetical protein
MKFHKTEKQAGPFAFEREQAVLLRDFCLISLDISPNFLHNKGIHKKQWRKKGKHAGCVAGITV